MTRAQREMINALYRREAFTANAAAVGQRGPAALGGTAVQKAVLAFATDFRRLILAFHKFKLTQIIPAKNRSLEGYQRVALCQGAETGIAKGSGPGPGEAAPKQVCFFAPDSAFCPGMSLSEHRQAIDQLDAKIVQLLNARTQHVLAIGDIKLKAGEEIYAPHRERAVLERVCAHNAGPMTNEQLRSIYREIMSSALALEKTMVIAYLGPEATFTHQAAIRRFGSSLKYASQKTIADVFTEVSKKRADYGVVPVENSTEGVVTHTLDMFVDSDLKIVSQIILPVQQCLMSNTSRAQIKKLYAHPQSLAQCRAWIQNHLPRVEIVETSSNARSAELAAQEKSAAALGGILAAEKYKLRVLEQDIQDNAANATRFLVLGRLCSPPTGDDRTSLMVSVADKSGALHQAIAAFRRFKINMTKIESRPSKRKAWEYFFFIDCAGHFQDAKVAKAIKFLGEHCNFVKVLGSYPNVD
jgi:chorismate mutase/prephenate dehydratase